MKTNKIKSSCSKWMLLVGVLVLLLAAGCATSKAPYYQSGFLHDYSKLKPDPELPGQMTYQAPDAELRKYKRFMLDPITVYLAPELTVITERINPETIRKVTQYFYDAIKKAVEPEYPVVDNPGSDVIRVRAAITGVEVKRKNLKLYQYLPIPLVIAGVSEAAGIRKSLAVVFMEAEMTDSLTGRIVSAAVWQNAGKTSVKTPTELNSQDVFPTLDYWAEKLRERADVIHGK